jgi:hypothetical protein
MASCCCFRFFRLIFFDFPHFLFSLFKENVPFITPVRSPGDRSSRYWVACSLEEAETMRGIIHNTTGWLVKGSNCAVGMRPPPSCRISQRVHP